MKKSIFWTILAAVLSLTACHEPEELIPAVANKGINAVTAYATWEGYHSADNTGFVGDIDYQKRVITIQVPYNIPVESDVVTNLEDYKKVWMLFNLDDNATLEPALLTMDLTKEYTLTLTDQKKQKSTWTIKAALKKSSACDIESFSIPSLGLSAIIDKAGATASLIYFQSLENIFGEVTISPHATIVPDPAKTAFWCSPDEPKKFTVIAQDGVTKRDWYLQQTEPARYEGGLRPESTKVLWEAKLSDVGVTTMDMTTGIAATDNHLIINTRGEDPIILDAKTGTPVGTLNIGSVKGANSNYYMTSDHKGHIIINNYVPDDGGMFRVWRMRDINSTPELFLEYSANGDVLGKHLSVWGDVYGDATLQTVYCGWTSTGTTSNFTWTVKEGVIDPAPHWCSISGMSKGWTDGDAIRMGTDATADFMACGYSANELGWVNGSTNALSASIFGKLTGNEGMKAVDAVNFNGVNYVMASMESYFTYGVSGAAYVFEAKYPQTFNGSLEMDASLDPDCTVWALGRGDDGYGKYGSHRTSGYANGNSFQDVKLHVTEDGYFMYAYFMFCNGYVGCVQFDCIAQ